MKHPCSQRKGIKLLLCIFGKLLLAILLGIMLILAWFYATAPVYKFAEPQPFTGHSFFNPYADIDSSQWKKGNFQVQSYAWLGLTNGRKNSNEAIYELYKQLGYDIIVTSDYQSINTFGIDSPAYIPTYEHGYGLNKFHQVCLGAKKVLWRDYPFFPSLSQKQDIINRLQANNDVIALAHPALRDGINFTDMKYLSGYHLIEVLNNIRFSVQHWDTALSNGHVAYIIGNDDAHDISKPNEVGRACTFINSAKLDQQSILDALKAGKAYGANIHMDPDDTFAQKAQKAKHIGYLKKLEVKNDTLRIWLSDTAAEIRFYTKLGKLETILRDCKHGFYKILPQNPYVRTEVQLRDKTVLYLNPVFRYESAIPSNLSLAQLDEQATLHWKLGWFGGFAVLCLLMFVIRVRNKKRK